jgi:hypothetical protein
MDYYNSLKPVTFYHCVYTHKRDASPTSARLYKIIDWVTLSEKNDINMGSILVRYRTIAPIKGIDT